MALLGGLFDGMFGWLIAGIGLKWSLIVISLLISFLITLSQKYLTNQELMKSLKAELKQLQKEMKTHKDNPEKMAKVNQELMGKNLQYMKQSMKPMLYTFLPIIIIFSWLRETFITGGDYFSWGFHIPFLGPGIGWLWTYILASVIFSIVMRRIMKIH